MVEGFPEEERQVGSHDLPSCMTQRVRVLMVEWEAWNRMRSLGSKMNGTDQQKGYIEAL